MWEGGPASRPALAGNGLRRSNCAGGGGGASVGRVASYTSVVQLSIPAHPPSGSRLGAAVAAEGPPAFQPPPPAG